MAQTHFVKPDQNTNSAFGLIPEGFLNDGDRVVTDRCCRCFGGFVFLEVREDAEPGVPERMAIAFHIVPGSLSHMKNMQKKLFREIGRTQDDFRVVRMIRCGGRIETESNRYFFDLMRRKIDLRFRRRFPDADLDVVLPEAGTVHMELELLSDFDVILRHIIAP